jgi:DNA-directed RNA polymerase specialized sigma24 family protein
MPATAAPAATTPVYKSAPRTRKAVVPPKHVPKDMSVFEYLNQCRPPLAEKIMDIACSQTQVPSQLRDDAKQEISIMWSQMVPDTGKFKPGQIAAYAHQMARHAALRTRRDLGSSVRLPGSAFRKRKDGSSYVTPGVLAPALDWNEMESWFNSEEGGQSPNAFAALRDDFSQVSVAGREEPIAEENSEEAQLAERRELLSSKRELLTPRQFAIMSALVEGTGYDEVMVKLGIKKGVLMRELAIAGTAIGPLGDY